MRSEDEATPPRVLLPGLGTDRPSAPRRPASGPSATRHPRRWRSAPSGAGTLAVVLAVVLISAGCQRADVVVGSKAFAESAILGEVAGELARQTGLTVRHQDHLGGTGLVWASLLNGTIDVYPDYTGTIARDILKRPDVGTLSQLRAALPEGIAMTESLGFENSYELGMSESLASQLGIETISDLRDHPQLRLGFGPEFVNRADGWPGLRARYELPQTDVNVLEHSLAYQSVQLGVVDVIDLYSTDAKIAKYGLRVLRDDLDYFPVYQGVFLYRTDLQRRAPRFVARLQELSGRIGEPAMQRANGLVELERAPLIWAAQMFLATELGQGQTPTPPTWSEEVSRYLHEIVAMSGQHLLLVSVSLGMAILVAIPLGVLAANRRWLQPWIFFVAEIIQTIPGLALLVLLLRPLQWLSLDTVGPLPAIIALFLYSLLPMIRNTYTGISEISPGLRESATVLGLGRWARLWQIELPLASPLILAGIKTTAVINVGYATLGGLIGAGGYGEAITKGLYSNDTMRMLQGALPAAALAIAVKYFFEASERLLVPRGLRIRGRS